MDKRKITRKQAIKEFGIIALGSEFVKPALNFASQPIQTERRRKVLKQFGKTTEAKLKSPDGKIEVNFSTRLKKGTSQPVQKLQYSVSFNGKSLIKNSSLSLSLVDITLKEQPDLGSNIQIVRGELSHGTDVYHLIHGKTSLVRENYNVLRLELQEPGDLPRKMGIEARAYNDGIAFRYLVPEQDHLKEFILRGENTEFNVSKDATSYGLVLPNYRTSYESEFIKLPISAFAKSGGISTDIILGLPLLMDVPGVGWMAIVEADLKDYSSMYITNPGAAWEQHRLKSVLAPQEKNPDLLVSGSLPHHSAWRVLLIT